MSVMRVSTEFDSRPFDWAGEISGPADAEYSTYGYVRSLSRGSALV